MQKELAIGSDRMYHPPIGFRSKQSDPSAYIAAGAVVLGDVWLAVNVSVWFKTVIRGDSNSIRVGARTNVQDGCILHADPGFPCEIGEDCTIGHGAIVHGAKLGNRVMIGMRAVVMNGAQIGDESIVGVGAIVTEKTIVPPRSVVLGTPARVTRFVTDKDLERIHHAASHYVELAEAYRRAEERAS